MVLQRERLYALIDERLPGAVWLHGPTGAGKTLLLRSWLQRDGRPSIWLTVDERHRDPAALFAAITALAAPHCEGPLPVFSPEHRDDPAAFALGYFERLGQGLDPSCAIVIDDVHQVVDATASLFSCAIEGCASRRRLLFASQLMPDSRFVPHLAGSRLWIVGHRLLAFDRHEARALAHRLGTTPPLLDALVAATDGWAAGLMLAMQFGASGGSENGSNDPLETVRTPLALLIGGQVLGGVPRDDIVKLRLMAELPQVPMELADVAPDWASACGRLQGLSERGLFVERLAADRRNAATESPAGKVLRMPKGCWRLHDLFRNALRDPGTIGDPDAVVGARLIEHLLEVDRLDLAWQLAAKLGASNLGSLIRTHGDLALRDSHRPELVQMAQAHVDRSAPEIAIWQARALIGSDGAGAIMACEEAFAGFTSFNDPPGVAMSVALALCIGFATIESVAGMTVWAGRFARVPRWSLSTLDGDSRSAIRVAGEVVHDLLIGGRAETAESRGAMQDRLMEHVLHEDFSADETTLAGSLLIAGMHRANRVREAELVILRVESLALHRRSAPHMRASWNIEHGYHFTRIGEVERARRCFDSALEVAEQNALAQLRVNVYIGFVRMELGVGDTKRALEVLATLESIGSAHLGRQNGWVLHLRSRYEALTGRPAAALGLIDQAEQLIFEAGFPQSAKAILDQDRIQMLFLAGRAAESEVLSAKVIATSSEADGRRIAITSGLLASHAAWDVDRERAEQLLVHHLEAARSLDNFSFATLCPEVASNCAARALEMRVAVDFVTRSIRVRHLPAPANAPSAWPWLLRVELLRAFRLFKDGSPLAFSGKAQQKPLELLKYLACTRDLIADGSSIASALWADGEDSAARKSLEVTISRLRKLLDDETLVIVKEGKVALDNRRVSSDVRDFAEAVLVAEGVASGRHAKAQVVEVGERLLRLFGEPALEHEQASAWREAVRERHRTAFVRAARALITYWELQGDTARAGALIEATLAREPLAENLYRMLMQIHLDAGDSTGAMRVYRQCRQMLSVLIGAQPSAETERLKNMIQL